MRQGNFSETRARICTWTCTRAGGGGARTGTSHVAHLPCLCCWHPVLLQPRPARSPTGSWARVTRQSGVFLPPAAHPRAQVCLPLWCPTHLSRLADAVAPVLPMMTNAPNTPLSPAPLPLYCAHPPPASVRCGGTCPNARNATYIFRFFRFRFRFAPLLAPLSSVRCGGTCPAPARPWRGSSRSRRR